MKRSIFVLIRTERLTSDTYALWLSGDTSEMSAPGQFVNIEIPGKFLRRPISVSDYDKGIIKLLVKRVGEGTAELVDSCIGSRFDVLSGLGNGFDIARSSANPVLAGGGIGIAPLYGLARELIAHGINPTIALGFRSSTDAFFIEEFKSLGCRVLVSTEDGSLGIRGFVTDCIKELPECDYVFACGPMPMLRALSSLEQLRDGQFSFEARMGCGFGACMGCSLKTVNGYKRVCKDGPVFYKEEIVW